MIATSTRRRLLFAIAAAALASVTAVAALFAVDLYLHHRADRSAGVNVRGYRGPVIGRKAPGETRVVVLGGSTVFGYGVPWSEALPLMLQQRLATAPGRHAFTVVNLGFNAEGAYASRPTLEDYEYLDYDVVCLYQGYNDLLGDDGPNHSLYRHTSPIFRLTGYFPIFPLVFREKAMQLRYGGDLAAAYKGQQTAFRPGLGARLTMSVLDASADISDSIDRQLKRVLTDPPSGTGAGTAGTCDSPWRDFCGSMAAAVDYAVEHGKRVLVVNPPILASGPGASLQVSQKNALATMLRARYGARPDVRLLDLTDAVDLVDPRMTRDSMHLTAMGNLTIAKALAAPVMELAESGPTPSAPHR